MALNSLNNESSVCFAILFIIVILAIVGYFFVYLDIVYEIKNGYFNFKKKKINKAIKDQNYLYLLKLAKKAKKEINCNPGTLAKKFSINFDLYPKGLFDILFEPIKKEYNYECKSPEDGDPKIYTYMKFLYKHLWKELIVSGKLKVGTDKVDFSRFYAIVCMLSLDENLPEDCTFPCDLMQNYINTLIAFDYALYQYEDAEKFFNYYENANSDFYHKYMEVHREKVDELHQEALKKNKEKEKKEKNNKKKEK